MTSPDRLEQIAEAMADLEAVFADPSCFHSPGESDSRLPFRARNGPVQDAAVSLASEFVGAYRDDEVTGRLAKLVDAEDAGSPKLARRHLTFVRLKVAARLVEWSAGAKDQVAETRGCRVPSQRLVVAVRPSSPALEAS